MKTGRRGKKIKKELGKGISEILKHEASHNCLQSGTCNSSNRAQSEQRFYVKRDLFTAC
jgi:hypothetical protein